MRMAYRGTQTSHPEIEILTVFASLLASDRDAFFIKLILIPYNLIIARNVYFVKKKLK